MLEIKGVNIIEGLPFEGLQLISELLCFEDEPMMLHLTDNRNNDWISYWVDFDKTGKRWLYGKVDKHELYHYLIGSKSLKQLFSEISSDYIFLIDCDLNENFTSIKMINSYSIPDNYFPGNNSFYSLGLSDFYKTYLYNYYYIDRLRQKSYKIVAESTNQLHGQTVGAKEAANVLLGATKSMEGFIDVTAFNVFKQQTGDRTKINKRINKIKESLSPRIAQNAFGSFEVWLTMDVITLDSEDGEEIVWRDNLIDEYKNNVLNVDISSEEEARIIAEKYNTDERRKIFEPLLKILDNENISITLSDYDNTFKRDYKSNPLTQTFREIVIPKQTIAELKVIEEKKMHLITAIIMLEEGKDIKDLKRKELQQNLLFTEENEVNNFEIKSPIIVGVEVVKLKKSIRCKLSIDNQNFFQISNTTLDLMATGKELKDVVANIKLQIISLTNEFKKNPDKADSRYVELKSILI